MKIGLIARGEDRGLGHLTQDFYRGFGADRVLLVEMGELARGFTKHADRFPDATHIPLALVNHRYEFDERVVREWLDGLDVVYSAETYYDWRMIGWARSAGVATVCHLMPEFWKHAQEDLPQPDAWWTPTRWRIEHLPPSTRVVPVPIPLDCPMPGDTLDGPLSFVHVAGHRAAQDRAGTVAFMRALQFLNAECRVRVITQDNRLPSASTPRHVTYSSTMNGVADRWDLYRDADAIVSPRRYGGLSLPVNEALGMGLGVIMSDCPPNAEEWPIVRIKVDERTPIRTGAGIIATVEPNPWAVASAMDACAENPVVYRRESREAAQRWAEARSWGALRPDYERAFREVLGGR